MPLNAENCMQNVKKDQNFILPFLFHLDGKKCFHKFKSSVLECKRFIFSSPV